MAKSKRPRKAYKPREFAIPMTIRHPAEADTDLALIPHVAMERFRTGCGDEEAWHTITCRLNIGLTLAHQTNQSEAYWTIHAGLDAMRAIYKRHQDAGKWGASGDNLRTMGQALVVTDDMQSQCTRRELAAAMRYVEREGAY